MTERIEHYEYDRLSKGDKVRIIWQKGDLHWDLYADWGGYDYGYQRYVSKAGEYLPLSGSDSDPEVYLLERYQKPWPATGCAIVFRSGEWRHIGLVDEEDVIYFDLDGDIVTLHRSKLDDWRRIIATQDLTEVSLDD